MILISLIGEQPAPNLLPTQHLQPQESLLVCTDRTRKTAERLKKVLAPICPCHLHSIDGYNIEAAQKELGAVVDQHYDDKTFVFNLTGGTKLMSLAAFLLAQERQASFLYFQSEGNRSRLLTYRWRGNQVELVTDEELSHSISLANYLHLYLDRYEVGSPRDKFEQEIYAVLKEFPAVECFTSVKPQGLAALEIDFVLRCGNQIGICEAKRKGAKDGIDQINAVAEQRYFGTYVHKFLCSGRELDKNNLALARAYNITIVELPSYGRDGALDAQDKARLAETILGRMNC